MSKKYTFFLSLFVVITILISCSSPTDKGNYSSSDIKDQVVQGQINGSEWSYLSGTAEIDYWDSTKISVSLYDSLIDGICDQFMVSTDRMVMFSVPGEEGEYQLSFNFSDGGQTVTMVYDTEDVPMNMIASEGIIIVDEITDTDITVSLVAHYGSDNAVNGTATVPLCE